MNAPDRSPNLVFRCPLPIVGAVTLLCLWTAWCEFPGYAWNETRLAPAFALRHGINPYPLIGGGPLSTWIYGPVGIIVNLPATFANSAENAVHLSSLINFIILIFPLAFIFLNSRELAGRDRALRWFALALSVLLIPRPNLVLQVADHAAIAFGLMSCWWLVKTRGHGSLQLWVSAGLCALAIWSKQISVFLVVAQVAYLLLAGERRAAIHYLLRVGAWTLLALGGAVWVFGWENLWINLVAIPGRLPWTDNFMNRITMRAWPLGAQVGLPGIGLIILWLRKSWPDRTTESGRFFQMTSLAYVTMLPVGLAAFFKIGGDTNLLHSWDYLLPGFLLAWLVGETRSVYAWSRMLAVTAVAIALHARDLVSLPVVPRTGHFATVAKLITQYPHAIWLPRNPVVTFYADGELWHSEDGILTRFLAGFGIREADFKRHLPQNLNAVAYPPGFDASFSMPLLPNFSQINNVEFWTVYTKPAALRGNP